MADLQKLPDSWSALNVDQLRTFQLVATTRSFSQTAEMIFVTPSAVSQRIASLEQTIGVPLLDRKRGHMPELTPAGEYLLKFCDQLAQDLLRLSARMDSIKRFDRSASLVLMASPSLTQHLIPLLANAFRQRHPDIIVRVMPAFDARTVLESIEAGDVDIGILPDSPIPQGIQKLPFFIDELILVTSARHPLAAIGRATVDQVVGERFVLPPLGRSLRELAERWAESVGMRLNIDVETASLEAIKHAVINLDMFTVVSRYAVANELENHILCRILIEGFPIRRTVCLISKAHEAASELAREFLSGAEYPLEQ